MLAQVPQRETSAARPLPLARLEGEIRLDGRPDEAEWAAVAPIDVFSPRAGAAPSRRTVVRLGYDERHLYVAAELGASGRNEISTASLTRDVLSADDYLQVVLDTYDDNEHAVGFTVTPAGV